jgi:uncharacterized protein YdiU (UPF0061 family)
MPSPATAAAATAFPFDNSFVRELGEGFGVPWKPVPVRAPKSLYFNRALAADLGLDAAALEGEAGAAVFAGNLVPEGAEPFAMAYAGHQFGHFQPQLGDGRALLLGEVVSRAGQRFDIARKGQRFDIALKGSGRTPFSRGGDGRAAVGPMLREVLIGEGMHALGIPSTRALAVAGTGEPVVREALFPGAVLVRVAKSHLRVGTFQFFAARGDLERLRALAEHTIRRHDPALAGREDRFAALLEAVARRQAALIAAWRGAGFVHGVMNTDNMALSGETIDYGPCAFIDTYEPRAVFSSIDHGGRYAFANQPAIAQWNLARFAETLLPLLDEPLVAAAEGGATRIEGSPRAVQIATGVVHAFPAWHEAEWLAVRRRKLGLVRGGAGLDAADAQLADDFLGLLHEHGIDHTLAWRRLADAAEGDAAPLVQLFAEAPAGQAEAPRAWLERWAARGAIDDGVGVGAGTGTEAAAAAGRARAERLRRANPLVIPRNHHVEHALAAASADEPDLEPFERLLAAITRPFEPATPETAAFAEPPAPGAMAGYQTFCGT